MPGPITAPKVTFKVSICPARCETRTGPASPYTHDQDTQEGRYE